MTTQDQLILVCEKLLGIVPHSFYCLHCRECKKPTETGHCPHCGEKLHKDLPPLTLDLWHECWLKLTPEQKRVCIGNLLQLALTDEYVVVYSALIAVEDL